MVIGSGLMGLGMSMVMLTISFGLWYGFWLMENDPASFVTDGEGEGGCPLPRFSFGTIMMSMMVAMCSLLALGNNATITVDAMAAVSAAEDLFARVDRTSQCDPYSEEGVKLGGSTLAGKVELREVVFAYPTRADFIVCRGYSLSVAAGDVCALCGPSGAGKSTIVSLLQRFYDPQGGSVLLDGVDVKTLNVSWLRAQMGLVSQEPVLFQGTVAENIGHGKEGSTQEEKEVATQEAA